MQRSPRRFIAKSSYDLETMLPMKRTTRYILWPAVMLTTLGCATAPIRYTLDRQPLRPTPLPYVMVVDVFTDARPTEERVRARPSLWSGSAADLYTSDADFRPNVAQHITEMLAQHLQQAGLFARVEVQELGDAPERDPQVIEQLRQHQVDLLMTARLTHFLGHQSGSSYVPAMLFGALGVLADAMSNPRTVSGYVEYADLKIVDVPQKNILWQGTINQRFERKETFYKGPIVYVLEALKATNADLATRLDKHLR